MDFRILGPFEVLDDGRRVAFGGAKQRALLVLLVIHANEPVATERLIDELWGEHPPATAAKTLQAHVSRLRRALEQSSEGAGIVVTRGNGYELRIDRERVDGHRFERLLIEGRHGLVAGRPERAAAMLEEALSLWRGPPLAEFAYERFAQAEIARLDELRIAALEELFDAKLALACHAEVVSTIEPLIAEHPYRERLRAQLMLALYRCDRQADALQAYQDARRKLVADLGIEPGERLRELERAILAQDSALAIPDRVELAAGRGREVSRTAFVGREQELTELLTGLQDACAGHGRLFLLCGEPGIGKSRLAEELVANARARGVRVLIGRCWEAGGAPAYWPWTQLLGSYVRACDREQLIGELGSGATEVAAILPELHELVPGLELPTAPESEGARFRLFYATAAFLRRASEKRPLVLVVDDLHAADTPSLLLLQYLARELDSTHVMLLCAMRDVDPIAGAPLTAMLAEVAREPVTRRLGLRGLSEHDVAAYIDAAAAEIASPPLAAAVYAETEGNPLFVSETVRLLSVEPVLVESGREGRIAIPPTVRDVISRRLARLSAECNRTLEQAAVLGREFSLDRLALLAGASEEQVLERLNDAHVARVVSEVPGAIGRLRFAHVVIRDTLYAGLTITHRVKLHRQAAAALKLRHGEEDGSHLAELAHHSIAGSEFDNARTYATLAGNWAMGRFAYEEAERLYRSALESLELAGRRDDRTRCELLLSLGDARARAGDTAAAQGTFLDAAELARRLGLGRELARAAAGYGGRIVWARAGRDARLVPLLEMGLAALPEDDLALRVRLLARLAGALRDEPSIERREAISREAVVLARRASDPHVLAYALDGCGSVIGGRPGTYAEQTALANELLQTAELAGDRERVVSGHYQKFIAAIGIGDVPSAETALGEASAVAEEMRQPTQLWQVSAARAMLSLAAGRLSEAPGLIAQALALGERAQRGMAIPTHTLQRYTLRDFQGRIAEIEPPIRDAATMYESQPVYRCALTYLTARVSRTPEAQRALAEMASNDVAAVPRDNEWLYGMSLLAEACSLLQHAPTASVLYRILAPYGQYNVVDTPDAIRGSVSRYLGLLASTLARWGAAGAHFDEALAANERMGFLPWLAHTQCDYARMLLTRSEPRDRDHARQLIGEALAIYRNLGMDSWAQQTCELKQSTRVARTVGP